MKQSIILKQLNIQNWYYMANRKISEGGFVFQNIFYLGSKALILETMDEKKFRSFAQGIRFSTTKVNLLSNLESFNNIKMTQLKQFKDCFIQLAYISIKSDKHRAIGQFIRKTNLKEREEFKNFESFLRLIRKIKHPNILQLEDVIEERDCMVCVHGSWTSSEEHILLCMLLKATQRLEEELFTLEIALDILTALDYLHTKENIIHNYMRENSVLVTLDEKGHGHAKLLDFRYAHKKTAPPPSSFDITGKEFLGYLSPEIVKGHCKMITTTFDIYCLGVILLRCFTGVTYEELKNHSFYLKPEWLEDLSPASFLLVSGLLNQNPVKRLKICDAMKIVNDRINEIITSALGSPVKMENVKLHGNRVRSLFKFLIGTPLRLFFQPGLIFPVLQEEEAKAQMKKSEEETISQENSECSGCNRNGFTPIKKRPKHKGKKAHFPPLNSIKKIPSIIMECADGSEGWSHSESSHNKISQSLMSIKNMKDFDGDELKIEDDIEEEDLLSFKFRILQKEERIPKFFY